MRYHIGYDASSFYLRAYEIWRQGRVFNPQDFVHQTNFFFDCPAPIAAFFMRFFNDVFLSYGLANIVVVLLIVFFVDYNIKTNECFIDWMLAFAEYFFVASS